MKKPYWNRVGIVAFELLASWWTTLPYMARQTFDLFMQIVGYVLGLALALVMPFTAILAPLWLWHFERNEAKAVAKKRLFAAMEATTRE